MPYESFYPARDQFKTVGTQVHYVPHILYITRIYEIFSIFVKAGGIYFQSPTERGGDTGNYYRPG